MRDHAKRTTFRAAHKTTRHGWMERSQIDDVRMAMDGFLVAHGTRRGVDRRAPTTALIPRRAPKEAIPLAALPGESLACLTRQFLLALAPSVPRPFAFRLLLVSLCDHSKREKTGMDGGETRRRARKTRRRQSDWRSTTRRTRTRTSDGVEAESIESIDSLLRLLSLRRRSARKQVP